MCDISRRKFLCCSAILAPALVACGSDVTEPAISMDDGIEILPDRIRIQLNRATSLNKSGGSMVVPESHVIIIRAADSDFRAFTNICTHAGCGIYAFTHPRIVCQCHGSEYNMLGENIAGPAPLPLHRFETHLGGNGVLDVLLTSAN